LEAKNLTDKIFVGQKTSFYKQLTNLLGTATQTPSPETGKTNLPENIVLLGIGGEEHDGGYLTDTIMIMHVDSEEKKASLISIPRDLQVEIPGYGSRKINAAFAEGYYASKDFDQAGALARTTLEKLTGLKLPYFAVVDFSGFEKLVTAVDGIDVYIDRTFTDSQYPDNNYGYLAPLTFKQGWEHMTGKRALQFARSRHAPGAEGNDFARSQRQHKVLTALKEKLTSLGVITSPTTLRNLLSVAGDHVHTNLSLDQLLSLYQLGKDFTKDDLFTENFDPNTGLVCDGVNEETGLYVLSNCPNVTSSDVQKFFSTAIERTNKQFAAKITVADSTVGSTLYASNYKLLTSQGFAVTKVPYTGKPLGGNIVYSLNDKPEALTYLTDKLGAVKVTLPPEGFTINKETTDFILILGKPSSSKANTEK
jgi:LCP family protein required for cell wall assembly